MKTPNLSLPIDKQLDKALRQETRRTRLSRAAVVRQILLRHFGLLDNGNDKAA